MTISVFDLFSIGIGPSSSHTVGPMRAAGRFVRELGESGALTRTRRVVAELYGSLAATGLGHGTVDAVILGLAGAEPETIDPDSIDPTLTTIRESGTLALGGKHKVVFSEDDVVLHRGKSLPGHPNGMRLTAYAQDSQPLTATEFYSIGGGFVLSAAELSRGPLPDADPSATVPYPFTTAEELLDQCARSGLRVSALMYANECALRPADQVRAGLLEIWAVMSACVERGCTTKGELPGVLRVRRRAAELHHQLTRPGVPDPLAAMDWVTMWAIAVNEENAAGGRVVTAPTNGAAGILPAVGHYYERFVPGAKDDGIISYLLAAAAIGIIVKSGASISGAEVGCQGEVGSACAMAAAGLADVLGAAPEQTENAAEIALEHNLGLTCDPVGGLVQIPCIERNAVASVKAITAARLALRGDGAHHVTLDTAVRTMRDTGRDMLEKYKETSLGGLAVNVIEC